MKTLFLDCGMGAAGDMFQSALVSLLSKEEQESFINKINNIGIEGVKVFLGDGEKCGIQGKHITVKINGEEEHSVDFHDHEHHHHHEHEHDGHHHEHDHGEHHHEHEHDDHHHEHHHTSMSDIEHMISHLNISDKVKEDVISVYKYIAEAESLVHGKPVNLVHFHEVGMKDALADIVGSAMLVEIIGADRIVASPINVGYGKVKCAHGILPVPTPATAEILTGLPTYAGRFEGEMCTPTGAALLKHYVDEFSNQPMMRIVKSGYGLGNKDFPAANVLKAVIGEDINKAMTDDQNKDKISELRCNVDDMTGEELAYTIEILLDNGAKDAFVTPVVMKKGRSGYLLTVLCDFSEKEKIANLIFAHTSTIGIRECVMERMILDRKEDIVNTEYGDVRIKKSTGFGVERIKAEFEDLKKISKKTGLSIKEIRKIVSDKGGF